MSNKPLVPEAQSKLDKLKMETANELGVDLNKKYVADLKTKEIGAMAGPTGGNMVKKMVEAYENKLK
ncbi:alpha/beta-type small acid-soluble spore protein [Clostridium sp. JS66]|uniref:alpha/beta-type small acid-soluble spore protein n=1 Tax=Clostridium sp. JS66 TaxID=3064705 RepID=UPI00298E4AE9|nr:alpha/beta-type small acid-soluble spore protein [Clostridium sp. JS66]WPC39543.1 alpha/beta-type small acid-soluble spore protein [Clostridium sp. JS66]